MTLVVLALSVLVMVPQVASADDITRYCDSQYPDPASGASYERCVQDGRQQQAAQQQLALGAANSEYAQYGCAGQNDDYLYCLPSGRWGGHVGAINYRLEPSGDKISDRVGDFVSMVGSTMRIIMPNMMLTIMQVCWNSALALSQYANSFDPVRKFGGMMDYTINTMYASMMNGENGAQIPAIMLFVGLVALFGAAVFGVGTTGEAAKRVGTTVVCVGLLFAMNFAALRDARPGPASDGAGSALGQALHPSEPATGSPWWIVTQINNGINVLARGVALNMIGNGSGDRMASDKHTEPNCQTYLAAMHDDYDKALADDGVTSTTAITETVNTLWEETALRSWVSMQWGSPHPNGGTDIEEARNAQQAYCHVIEATSGTSTSMQKDLTNRELGSQINDKTAYWIFQDKGWIDPWNSAVNNADDAWDRGPNVYRTRMGVFWETCSNESNETGQVKARYGWDKLVNNLGTDGFDQIEGSAGATLRSKNGQKLDDVKPKAADNGLMSSTKDAATINDRVKDVCGTVLGNKAFQGNIGGYGSFNDTQLGDAATLGWRFDVPNVNATFTMADMANPQAGAESAVRPTLDMLYGNTDPDTLGAFGSVVGSVCALVVFGGFSVALIVSKLMLTLMILFLFLALMVRAFPIGDKPKQVLKNWAKATCQFSMVGAIYSLLGSLSILICDMALQFTSDQSGTFLYNLVAGASPALAVAVIGMFCKMVLKVGNPFSFHAMMSMAASDSMAGSLAHGFGLLKGAGMAAVTGVIGGIAGGAGAGLMGAAGRFSQEREKAGDRPSSRGGAGDASKSSEILTKKAGGNAEGKEDGRHTLTNAERHSFGRFGRRTKDAWTDMTTRRRELKADRMENHLSGKDMERYHDQGMSWAEAKRKADADYLKGNVWHGAGTAARYAGRALSTVGAAAWTAARNKPLRQTIGRVLTSHTARTVVSAGLTAAAFTNPVTAPLGVAMAGRMMVDRDTWGALREVGSVVPNAMATVWENRGNIGDSLKAGMGWLGERKDEVSQRAPQAAEPPYIPADLHGPVPGPDGTPLAPGVADLDAQRAADEASAYATFQARQASDAANQSAFVRNVRARQAEQAKAAKEAEEQAEWENPTRIVTPSDWDSWSGQARIDWLRDPKLGGRYFSAPQTSAEARAMYRDSFDRVRAERRAAEEKQK